MIRNYRDLTEFGISNYICRSASLDDIDENDVSFLKSRAISSILDFRYHKHKRSYSFLSEHGFQVFNHGLNIRIFFENYNLDNMSEEYMAIASQTDTICKIIKCIADSSGNVLLYCSWGKDRTGVIMAIILMIAGVDIDIIANDYSKSDGICSLFMCDHRIPDYARQANPQYIIDFYMKFIDKYGSIENYCKLSGISEVEISSIKRKVCFIG